MYRCASDDLRRSALTSRLLRSAIGALALWAGTGHAQGLRPFPANALRGTLEVTQPPAVLLNGQATRLTPGARIRGQDNLIHLSGSLAGQSLLVHYTMDGMGHVHNVWVLTPDEAARKPWPTTSEQLKTWRFDAASQTWSRP